MKLMILGDAQHGKDTVCKLLVKLYDLTFISSSYFCTDICVRSDLAKLGIIYETAEDCYADRINHRDKWYNSIAEFNRDNPARLGSLLFAQYNIYCGNRNPREFYALKRNKIFDCAFWVDASKRVKPEPRSSQLLTIADVDYIIDNNGDEDDLHDNIIDTMDRAMDDGRIEFKEPNFILS